MIISTAGQMAYAPRVSLGRRWADRSERQTTHCAVMGLRRAQHVKPLPHRRQITAQPNRAGQAAYGHQISAKRRSLRGERQRSHRIAGHAEHAGGGVMRQSRCGRIALVLFVDPVPHGAYAVSRAGCKVLRVRRPVTCPDDATVYTVLLVGHLEEPVFGQRSCGGLFGLLKNRPAAIARYTQQVSVVG